MGLTVQVMNVGCNLRESLTMDSTRPGAESDVYDCPVLGRRMVQVT